MRKPSIRHIGYAFILLLGMGASDCDRHRVKLDESTALAVESNDYTAIISGCGNQPAVGYTYCRVAEGQPTEARSITVHVPPTACPEKECAQVRVFDINGQVIYSKMIPRGQTELSVSWKELTGSSVFAKNQRGFWQVVLNWKWIGPDGREGSSIAFGEMRLRVLSSGYLGLENSKEDPNFAWAWSAGKNQFRMTTAGRASAWKEP